MENVDFIKNEELIKWLETHEQGWRSAKRGITRICWDETSPHYEEVVSSYRVEKTILFTMCTTKPEKSVIESCLPVEFM